MKFRKKPVVIEAEQFVWEEGKAIKEDMFMAWPVMEDIVGIYLLIPTLEGDMRANSGDWIIQGVKGEFYPVKNDIFQETYEEVEESEGD